MKTLFRTLIFLPLMSALFPSAGASAKGNSPKLRILCLHGFHGTVGILKGQIEELRTTFEPYADLVFVDSPSHDKGGFGWWHAIHDAASKDVEDPGVEGSATTRYVDWELSRAFLVDLFEKEGPFDGILGFSQGGALTGLLTGMRAPDGIPTPARPLKFDFSIEFSGYTATDPRLVPSYSHKPSFDIPSLHVIGRADTIVYPKTTEELARHYKNPNIIYHDDGHIIASTPEVKTAVRSFLTKMSQNKLAKHNANPIAKTAAAIARPTRLPLWSDRAHPDMSFFFPKQSAAKALPAILVFPGGAYSTDSGSGSDSPQWLAEQGIVGIKVEYGTKGTQQIYPSPLADAARAVRIVRSRAKEWGIDPKRIGIMGFSAGGHLAALLATQPELYMSPKDDLAKSISARPDLLMLAYPLVSFVNGYSPGAYAGSVDSFFGKKNPSEADRKKVSSELHVSSSVPPTFIWTTMDDSIVPGEQSKAFADALRKVNVSVKSIYYPHGPHGLGLARREDSDVKNWTKELMTWIRSNWAGSF